VSTGRGYVIALIDVTDEAAYARYREAAPAIIAAFGGRYLVRGGPHEAPEGPARSRHVVLEFPDFATARAFYHSDAYQTALKDGLAGSVRELVLVEGVPA
jgi:uncharacterized protein (DUF1330 family)